MNKTFFTFRINLFCPLFSWDFPLSCCLNPAIVTHPCNSHPHSTSPLISQQEIEALLAHIHLPLDTATERLGMYKGKIKTLMSRLGIRRWPSKWVLKCVEAHLQLYSSGRPIHSSDIRNQVGVLTGGWFFSWWWVLVVDDCIAKHTHTHLSNVAGKHPHQLKHTLPTHPKHHSLIFPSLWMRAHPWWDATLCAEQHIHSLNATSTTQRTLPMAKKSANKPKNAKRVRSKQLPTPMRKQLTRAIKLPPRSVVHCSQ